MPRFTISKEFHFSASHRLFHLLEEQPEHPCGRDHGHNYVVRVAISGEQLNSDGFIVDYNNLDWFKEYIDREVDHRNLNEVMGGSYETTAENLAKHFYTMVEEWIKTEMRLDEYVFCEFVEVEETPKTRARYGR